MSKESKDELDELLFKTIYGELADDVTWESNKPFIKHLKQELQAYIYKQVLEIIGEDDQYTSWSERYKRFLVHREELVDTRNDLREGQRQAAKKFKGKN